MARSEVSMADQNIEVYCPCCDALLVISRETGQVLSHKQKTVRRDVSFEEMVSHVHSSKSELEKRFQKEMESQKDRQKLLDEKFRAAVERAKKSDE
jgi:uncharacterized Zn finger protein (UPF0148 family)